MALPSILRLQQRKQLAELVQTSGLLPLQLPRLLLLLLVPPSGALGTELASVGDVDELGLAAFVELGPDVGGEVGETYYADG